MPRTNLKKAREAVDIVAEAILTRLAEDREEDAAHIERHADASQEQLDRLTLEEGRLIAYVENMRAENIKAFDSMVRGVKELFAEMRADEEKRLVSLQAHVKDIATEDERPVLPAEKPPRLLKKSAP